MTDVKKGQILRLTYGCYSDWNIHSELLVLQDFNVQEKAKEYGTTIEAFWDEKFTEWLVKHSLVSTELPQEVVEVHMGDYSFDVKNDFFGMEDD